MQFVVSLPSLRDGLRSRTPAVIPYDGRRRAAVLVPVYGDESGLRLLYTVRTQFVGRHKGEVSFPGGMCEAEDASCEATALREAFEEVGVQPHDVQILGTLDDVEARSEIVITPIVGLLKQARYAFTMQASEVGELLEVPLAHLADPLSRVTHPRLPDAPAYGFGRQIIWGATARITTNLLALIGAPVSPSLTR